MKTHITLYCSILLFGASSIFAEMNDARLKERLKAGLLTLLTEENFSSRKTEVTDEHSRRELKDVTDEQFHRVLMELYKEAESKWPTLTPNTGEWATNKQVVISVLACLHMCAGSQTKNFLLEYASSKEKDNFARTIALSSYLRIADAEEAKDVLLRFLVGEERMAPMERMSLYSFARMVYEDALQEKKTAILAALIAAAGREEGKIEFMKVDTILAERSAAYQRSRERLAMLERHSMEPPTSNLYTDRDLKAALTESRNYKQYTSVSTNLAMQATQDFNLPQPGLLTNDEAVRKDTVAEPQKADMEGNNPSRYAFFGMLALLLLGFGAWRFMRK